MRVLLLLMFFGILGCSSSEPMMDSAQSENLTSGSENSISSTNDSEKEIAEYPYLSSLSDTYRNRSNDIPSVYSELKQEIVEENTNPYEGYRIQIFSGQNVALADTAAKRFRTWSAEHIGGYQADTYTFFKAPYYRVHVGDFHEREEAIAFSNMIKRRFRDSWVVFDRVDPFKVPADSVVIFTKD